MVIDCRLLLSTQTLLGRHLACECGSAYIYWTKVSDRHGAYTVGSIRIGIISMHGHGHGECADGDLVMLSRIVSAVQLSLSEFESLI